MNRRIIFSVGVIVLVFLGLFVLQPAKQESGNGERINRAP